MNFIYIGDMHERIDAPSSRIDDYKDTVNKKAEEIKELANKYNAKAILQGGDFLDKPSLKTDFVAELIKKWSNLNFNEMIETLLRLNNNDLTLNDLKLKLKDCIPLFGVVGNHEIYGNNLNTLSKTMIKFLNDIGFMTILSKDKPIIFTTEDNLKVAITGTSYHSNMDSDKNIDDYIVENKMGDIHIHIVHGMLTDKCYGNLFKHTLVKDIAKRTKADLTISGHDHIGFPLTEIDGKYFVNPGSPIRSSANLKELERKPKILLISIDKTNGLKIKELYLKSAKKAESVLNRDKIEEEIKRKENLEDIKNIVLNVEIDKGNNIKDIIKNIAINKNIPEEIKNDVINEISEKLESEPQNKFINTESYYIRRLILENFQSHSESIIDLDEGLNVIIGESRQGKTAILRALSFLYENKSNRNPRRYIKRGTDYCSVKAELSNGISIKRIVERKANGKNGYEVCYPGKEVEYFNTKAIGYIQEILGFYNLEIDKDLNISLNFLRQGEGWFLIGDKYTSPDREKIIGGIYDTHLVDSVRRKYNNENRTLLSKIKNKKEEKEKLEENIKQYDYLTSLKNKLENIKKEKEKISILEDRLETIKKVFLKYEKVVNQIKTLDLYISKFSNIDKYEDSISHISNRSDLLNKLVFYNEQRKNIIKRGLENKNILSKLENMGSINVEEIVNKYEEIKEKKVEYLNYKKIYNRKVNIKEKIIKLNKQIENTENIDILTEGIKKTLLLLNEVKDKEDILKQSNQLIKKKNNCIKEIEENNDNLKKLSNINKYSDIIISLEDKLDKRERTIMLNKQRKDIIISGKQQVKIIKNTEKENEYLIEQYKEYLKKKGTCPLCFSKVDKNMIDRIVQEYKF